VGAAGALLTGATGELAALLETGSAVADDAW